MSHLGIRGFHSNRFNQLTPILSAKIQEKAMKYELNFAVSCFDDHWILLLKALAPDGSWSYLNSLKGLDSLLGLKTLPQAGNQEIVFDTREDLKLAVDRVLDHLDSLAPLLDEDCRAREWYRPDPEF